MPPAATQSSSAERSRWDDLASREQPSWYLDPLVALQKRRVHQDLIRRWIGLRPRGRVFKTDLFEDAWGLDRIIFDVFEQTDALLGTDIAESTVAAATRQSSLQPLIGFVSDVRALPLADGAVDVALSMSTLDHFDNREEFRRALAELVRTIRIGGDVVITLDNPHNPTWPLLRAASSLRLTPFRLGYTPSLQTFTRELRGHGFEILDTAWLIHNPRLVSTAAIRLIRRLLRDRADAPIAALLRLFEQFDRLPTRRFTACFYGVHARKVSR